MTLTEVGLSGAFCKCFRMGLSRPLSHVVGRMVYDRNAHTRFGGVGADASLEGAPVRGVHICDLPAWPRWACLDLADLWRTSDPDRELESLSNFRVIAGVGIMIGVAYTIRAISDRSFPGERDLPTRNLGPAPEAVAHPLEPISMPERIRGCHPDGHYPFGRLATRGCCSI